MKARKFLIALPLAAAVLSLAACGGGGGDGNGNGSNPPPQAADPLKEVPSSASQSTAGLMSYLESVRPLDAEARDPASLDSFTPPMAEDSEPQSVSSTN